MTALQQEVRSEPQSSPRRALRFNIVRLIRAVPIRWRILAIAGVNAAVVLVLAGLIWDGARTLNSAWDDVRRVRESDRLLAVLEGQAGRLQSLIHRYINQPNPQSFAEILLLREAVLGTLSNRGIADPVLSGSIDELQKATEKFLDGFGDLRNEQAIIAKTYEEQVLTPAREMSGLYAIIDSAIANQRFADLAVARKVARGLYRHVGRGQFLLSFARLHGRRGGASLISRRSRRRSLS